MGCPFSSNRYQQRYSSRLLSRVEPVEEQLRHSIAEGSPRHAHKSSCCRSLPHFDEKQQLLDSGESGLEHRAGSGAPVFQLRTPSLQKHALANARSSGAFVKGEYEESNGFEEDGEIEEHLKISLTAWDRYMRSRKVVIAGAISGIIFRALDTGLDIRTAVRFIADDKIEWAVLTITFILVSPLMQCTFVYWKRRQWNLAQRFLVPASMYHLRREVRQYHLVQKLPQFALYQNIHVLAGGSLLNSVLAGIESSFESFPQAIIQWHAYEVDGDADLFNYMSLVFSCIGVASGIYLAAKAVSEKARLEEVRPATQSYYSKVEWANASSAGDTLGLHGTNLNKETVRALADFIAEEDFITVFGLSQTNCEDDHIAILVARACNLLSIDLRDCSLITDKSLMTLAEHCRGLTTVSFEGCSRISDEGLKTLAEHCRGLTVVNLRSCTLISDEGLKTLAEHCRGLATVNLVRCTLIGDEGLETLAANCRGLTTAYFGRCTSISDVGLKALAEHCRGLTTVDLGRCHRISDEGFKALAENCRGLTTVDLRHCTSISDESLKILAEHCMDLTTVDLRSCTSISDEGLKTLAEHCRGLTTVSLHSCASISDEGLKTLAEHCRDLIAVSLHCCTSISDEGLKALAENCSALTTVNLHGCTSISDAGLKALAEHCRGLTTVYLGFCTSISDEGLKTLAEHCRGLTTVELSDCTSISDEGLKALAEHCSGLTTVDLQHCTSISDEGLEALAQHCKIVTM